MTDRMNRLSIALTAAVVSLLVTCVYADSVTLELKRLPADSTSPAERVFLSTSPQTFLIMPGRGLYKPQGSKVPNFSEVIKKELPKYQTDKPFRAVASLGSQYFGFVLDTAAKEKGKGTEENEAEPSRSDRQSELVRYNRLIFDLNRNGDLTDDKVIAGKESQGRNRRLGRASYSFPRVDVAIEADGVKMEYAFTFSVYSTSDKGSYVSASLNAAAYRHGEITLGEEKKRIVLLDYNSNGRFDDEWRIDPRQRNSTGKVYPKKGDMLLVAPATTGVSADPRTTNDSRQFLGKLVNIDGRFFDVKASPTGDTLTLGRSSTPVGHVTNPTKACQAVVYSDIGFMKIGGDGSGKWMLPQGDWKLASYTAVLPEDQRSSKFRNARVSAYGTRDYVAVKVHGGKTVEFPFGPPYTPKVTVSHRSGAPTASFLLSLVGAGGEVCNSIAINGRRPPSPEFTITDPDGKEIEIGKFKYG